MAPFPRFAKLIQVLGPFKLLYQII